MSYVLCSIFFLRFLCRFAVGCSVFVFLLWSVLLSVVKIAMFASMDIIIIIIKTQYFGESQPYSWRQDTVTIKKIAFQGGFLGPYVVELCFCLISI